jgi:hypothetical protein
MADVQITIDAKGAKAINSLLKMSQAQGKVETATKKAGRAAKTQEVSTKQAAASMGKFIRGAAGLAGVTAGFAGLNRMIEATARNMASIAKEGESVGNSLVRLATLGINEEERKDIVLQGAQRGIGAEESAKAAAIIDSVGKTQGVFDEADKKELDVALKLQQLQVESEAAGNIVAEGINREIGGEAAANLVLEAAASSKLEAKDFARSLPATKQFSTLEQGLAATSALSTQELKKERIPELLKGTGQALQDEESDFSKKFGLEGLSETEKIRKLRTAAEQSKGGVEKFTQISSLQRAGVKEKIGAEGIGALIRAVDVMETVSKQLQTPGAEIRGEHIDNLLENRIADIESAPDTGTGQRANKTKATREALKAFGPDAEESQRLEAMRKRHGLEAEAQGKLLRVNDEGKLHIGFRQSKEFFESVELQKIEDPFTSPVDSPFPFGGPAAKPITTAAEEQAKLDATIENTNAMIGLKESIDNLTPATERDAVATEIDAVATERGAIATENAVAGGGPTSALQGANGETE